MRWVTRQHAKVDRIACPWLIRRFIDPQAEFLFVPDEAVLPTAHREGAVPFDVPGVELGHVEGRCSFESILRRYGLTDPALQLLGRIVHGADIPQDLAIEPEAPGLRAIAHGFALLHGADDQTKLQLEMPLYDALYRWCQKRVASAR
ncbi:MAG: chromate resistance protein [Armatimonadota bacterium]|nr:chromate resistance protein [Armatimonadota bacterium]MDR7448895.1 chromate resistance protein [Armatimonadota bacterium]MDR7460149.1 chromate resistance protein [Armatimonadota bacterium]MDR7479225.1 chromate resistance protein [Armatimonadota bacterium]MDR7487863.1 chromate resistance protein [Armatimonadota bacterium]